MAGNQQNTSTALKSCDPAWDRLREEAQEVCRNEPVLASFVYSTVINQDSLELAICHRLAQRLSHAEVDVGQLSKTFEDLLSEKPELGEAFRADLAAVYRSGSGLQPPDGAAALFQGLPRPGNPPFCPPALGGWPDPILPIYLQSQSSRASSAVDIHPAAKIGRGIMIDHATASGDRRDGHVSAMTPPSCTA